MERANIPTIAAVVPCDYVFAIDYLTARSAVHIIKGVISEQAAWRRLACDNDLRGVRSITVEVQPV